jgi:hypothetical protein
MTMRPAYKVLKALLQHEAWRADWYVDATGAFRTDMQLYDDTTDIPLDVTVCPLGWLEWQLNHDLGPLIEEETQEPFLPYTPEVVEGTYGALNLDAHEARYLLSLQRALARVLGIDPMSRQALQAAAPFRLSEAEKAAAQQRAVQRRARQGKRQRWEIEVVWPTVWPDHPPDRYRQFAHALEGAQVMIMLFSIEGEKYQHFLQYDGDMEKRQN